MFNIIAGLRRSFRAFRTEEIAQPVTVIPAHELQDAIRDLANVVDNIGYGEVWTALSCTEVHALSRVLLIAGHADSAAHVIACHAEGDDILSPEDIAANPNWVDGFDMHSDMSYYANERGDYDKVSAMAREYVTTSL
ncbi:hypothetical protein ACIA8K_12725 [Catenuloplanes sp. NPDC051500]|uniref:hypothetical protein n=1 Tax=Catenuloplanes sp. NPDC051500 TaxID=3363959 RepID=UPI0037AD6897